MESSIFGYMQKYDYENILLCHDGSVGLKAIIAIHDTTLGPATGGTRMWTYESELDAVEDALRLARGMTYKYAAAGINLGGGKCVIMGDPKKDKSEALFRALGRFINRLNGTYLTGEDVGTTLRDMEYIRMETPFVVTLPAHMGGAGPIGGATAVGTLQAMRACLKEVFGDDSLKGRSVALQGLGVVGSEVIKLLIEAGAKVTITDIDAQKLEAMRRQYGVAVAAVDAIHTLPVDVYCPCALGGVINDRSLPEFHCRIIAGSANNQLKDPEQDGVEIERRGILYAPDYITNAGGTIFDTDRINPGGFNAERAWANVRRIYETTAKVIETAKRERIPTYLAADRLAEERIAQVRNVKALATHGSVLREAM